MIFFGFLAVPAAIYYSIQLWNHFTNKAELSALVKTNKVELPAIHNEFLQAIDSPIGRQQLRSVYDAVSKDKANANYLFKLDVVPKFTDSIPIFGWRDIDVVTLKIVNVGRKAANNVKVFFPIAGFAEITMDRAVVSSGEYRGWIELGTLEPSSQFVVHLWTATGSLFETQGIRITSDGGAASVREWYVSRDENRWVIGFGLTEIVLFGAAGLFICFVILGLVASALEVQPKKAGEQTHEGSSEP